MDILEVKNLKKSFNGHAVIRDLSFQVPEHSVFGFLGENGAGKTTTMKMILGLLQPDAGEIRIAKPGFLWRNKNKPHDRLSA
ncbi:ATP-binding cassette domain-containing protein [Robinsoniella sp. KNHs210]|uniref:ATP-binding cassette domain-containing protein n=1 Tax=Robinsoniella sp. KNHs210 TaxID=1469950 RepID=UPI000A549ED7|nr:ATP-binding cassette domain-containing protein [Robinsoniella sp. KNHs210]